MALQKLKERPVLSWEEVPLYFDYGYAARIFWVTPETIKNWVKTQGMPVYDVGNNSPRFDKLEVMKWVKEQRRSKKINQTYVNKKEANI